MSMSTVPRVSIGLPVYNGENFLAQALDALLGQSFTDLELIISDNASTDATAEICRRYAAQDERIRYVRQPRNLGGARNQAIVGEMARGELFKLAAHDDLYGRDLIARCVEVLDAHPDVVLCHADMAFIDASGEIIGRYDYTMATDSPSAPERFRSLLRTDGGDDEYGVIRTEVLRRVRAVDSYHNPGRPYVAEIALHGRFEQVPELLYFRRDHPDRGDRSPTISALCARMDPRRASHSNVRLLGEYVLGYFRAVHRAPLSTADRVACYRHLVGWLASRAANRSWRVARGGGRLAWRVPTPEVDVALPERPLP
ncbi:glycosyltransferase family 2 protein [Nocardioides koreensis]|uniref:Glycosyltransferase family 2 protein n=1 Tax=Nocardioides koreensis TaxID=433651 RepID=A0ABP5LDM9_9ACTN